MLPRLAAIVSPAILFVVLASIHARPPDRYPRFPTVDRACGEAVLVLPPSCEQVTPQPCTSCTLHTCRMRGDWSLELSAAGLVDACTYEVRSRDKGLWADDAAHWLRGGREVPCERRPDGLRCRLALDPVRVVSLGLVAHAPDGRIVSPSPARVIVGRDGALDVRDEAIAPTIVIGLVAVLLALGIVALGRRLRWPDAVVALDRRRALLAGSGACASIVLGTFLPADVGGFDAREPLRLVWLLPAVGLVGSAMGPIVARARQSFEIRSGSHRVVLALGATFTALAFSLAYRLALSEDAQVESRVTVKHLFYSALGVSFFLPSMILPVDGVHRAAKLLGATVLGASILGAVALATGHLWEPSTHQGLLGGFYKPPSAFAITVVELPFLAALAVAVSAGRASPPWLDALMSSLDGALADSGDRIRHVHDLGRDLARRVDALARARPEAVAPLSYFAPLLIAPLLRDANERAQLDLDAADVAALERSLALLIAARLALPYHDVVAGSATSPGIRARVQLIPWPRARAEVGLVVVDGAALLDDPELRRRLAPLASWRAHERLRHGGYVVVDVACPERDRGGTPEPLDLLGPLLPPARDSRMVAP